MDDQKKQPGRAEQTAQSTISKKIGQSVSTRIVQSAAGKAIGGALGSVVPVVGNIIGGLVGGLLAGAITKGAKEIGKTIGTLPFTALNALNQLANVLAATVAQTAQLALGSLVLGFGILAVFIAFTLFIINSGAYVVPPGQSLLTDGGPGSGEPGSGGGGISVPSDCQTNDLPQLPSFSVEWSGDRRYAFPMAWPNGISCSHWISQGSELTTVFATDIFPIKGSRVPLVAYTSGTIALSVPNDPYGGKYIILRGSDGRHYYYAHLCKVLVKTGQNVAAGELIGLSDSTGLNAQVTPEHLHFAINSIGSSFIPEGSGNVCPSTDFQNKFGQTRCAPQDQCTLTRMGL